MIGWIMRRIRPGSFAWLTLHELRLALLARGGKPAMRILGWLFLAGYCAVGMMLALALHGVPIPVAPIAFTVTLAIAIGLFTFMTTQAMLASQRALYEAGDLDLLFSAPLPPRRIVAAKLAGITGTVVLTFALFVLPIALPVALLGHPRLFGIPALIAALALAAACLGLSVTLLLARIAGPRAARTVGQIVAALSGGAIFLTSQLMGHADAGRQSGIELLFERMRHNGFGTSGLSALPGRAAFGDPLAIAVLLGAGIAIFAATAWGMQTLFLHGYRAGGMRLSRARPKRGGIARHFHRGLFGAVFAKEWRLLARDPALAFQIVLRLVYLAPIMLIAVRSDGDIPLAPSLAFSSVIIAGQMVASLAWLGVSAEDSPDLIRVAPVAKEEVDTAKLLAAMALAAPFMVLLPIGIALETLPGALIALGFTVAGGWIVGQLEVTHAEPAPRSTFQRRQSGSFLRGLIELVITVILGVVAGAMVALAQAFL